MIHTIISQTFSGFIDMRIKIDNGYKGFTTTLWQVMQVSLFIMLSIRNMRTMMLRCLYKFTWLESSLLKGSPGLSLFSLTFYSVLCTFSKMLQHSYEVGRLGNISILWMKKLMWRDVFKDAFSKCSFRVYMNRVPKFWAVWAHSMGGGVCISRKGKKPNIYWAFVVCQTAGDCSRDYI